MDLASSLLLTLQSLPIWDAVNGTGTIKFAFNAQTDGLSMQIRSVLLSVINAKTGMQMVYVLLVSKAMI